MSASISISDNDLTLRHVVLQCIFSGSAVMTVIRCNIRTAKHGAVSLAWIVICSDIDFSSPSQNFCHGSWMVLLLIPS